MASRKWCTIRALITAKGRFGRDVTGEQARLGRSVNDAQDRRSVADQGDVDGEVTSLLDKFLRPVEWIHQEELVADLGHSACSNFLLGNHGNLRGDFLQAPEDDRFCSLICI